MPTWPVHLAIANKLSKKYHYTDDFIIGNILPDVMYGFVVPDISNQLSHTVTHYSEKMPIGFPKINLNNFLQDNRKKLNNELILGVYIHLITDRYFNEYTMKHHIKIEDCKPKGILNDGTISKDEFPMFIKQNDFKIFGEYFIKNKEIGNNVNITNNTMNLTKDLNYKIEKEDIEKAIKKINELINNNPKQENYQMFTEKELLNLYNNCYSYIEEKLHEVKEKEKISKAFDQYTSSYDMEDSDINYKYYHSYRVMENSIMLSERINLSKKDKYIAAIIGLYHDIGRFKQDQLFDSYVDTKAFDHGNYGEEILINQQLIKQIPIEEQYYNIIAKSVKNHNKYKIEDNLTDKELFHAKLIRDADKLDIIYYMSEKKLRKKAFDYDDNTFDVRESIKEEFFRKEPIYIKDKPNKTNSEKAIIMIALTFDLRFKETAEYILENHVLDNLYNVLPNKENYKEYIRLANKYLKEMIEC